MCILYIKRSNYLVLCILRIFLLQARAGICSTVDVLKVARAFENETNYTVWSDLATNLSDVSVKIQYTDQHDNFKSFIRSLFGNIANKLGWEKKDGEGMSPKL